MIVQCSDGLFYKDPIWRGPNWVVQCLDETLLLTYDGKAQWVTARRVLYKAGFVKATVLSQRVDEEIRAKKFGHKLMVVSIFELDIDGPPGPPVKYKAVSNVAVTLEEKVLQWEPKSRKPKAESQA